MSNKPYINPADKDSLEARIAAAARTITHCGDYGQVYYNVSTGGVSYVMGDADAPENDYTSSEDIRRILEGVRGVQSVTIENETAPKGDAWIKVGRGTVTHRG